VYRGQTVGWVKMQLDTEVGPDDIVLDGDPGPPRKGAQRRHLSAHVYCGQTVTHLSNSAEQSSCCTARGRVSEMSRHALSVKITSSHGDLDPSNTWFLGQPQFTTKTASRSVQPFLQGSLLRQTDRRQTRYSICKTAKIGHIYTYICSTGDAGLQQQD